MLMTCTQALLLVDDSLEKGFGHSAQIYDPVIKQTYKQ